MQIKVWVSFLLFVTITVIGCDFAIAADSEVIEVVATGIGQDSDGALKNALRAAVEQAVGTLVDSETLAENDEVVNDKILSYSAGFVESHKALGEPRVRDGLVTIRIQAQVKRTQLAEKLKAENIQVKEMDGESLFGAAITKLEQKQNATEMIVKALEGFPENCLIVKVEGKPDYDENKQKVNIKVSVSIDENKYDSFISSFSELLKKTSLNSNGVDTPLELYPNGQLLIRNMPNDRHKESSIQICERINESLTRGAWVNFEFPEETLFEAIKAINIPTFTLNIVDEKDKTVMKGTYDLPVPYFAYQTWGFGNAYRTTRLQIFPLPDSGSKSGRDGQNIIPGKKYLEYTVSFDATPNEVKKMRRILINVEKGNNNQLNLFNIHGK